MRCWCCTSGADDSDQLCDRCAEHGASKTRVPEGFTMRQG